MTLPQLWASVDPGDSFNGVAVWCENRCQETHELTPHQLDSFLEVQLGERDQYRGVWQPRMQLIVLEKWSLYPWNEKSMSGSEFLTSQQIGVVRYMCRKAGITLVMQPAHVGKSTYKREPFKQWGTRQWRQAIRGPIGRGHTRDAWAHGVEFMRKRGLTPAA